MKQSTKPMKRGKSLGPGKKTLKKRADIASAIGIYFGMGEEGAPAGGYCQLSGANIYDFNVVAHHKTPRSEMRKAGIKDLDAPHRLLILHPQVHHWLHNGQMGRPKDPLKAELYARVEASTANAENGQRVELSEQDRLDLERFMRCYQL